MEKCDLCCDPDKPKRGIQFYTGTHRVELRDAKSGEVYASFNTCSDCEGKLRGSAKGGIRRFVAGLQEWEYTA